MPVSGRPRVSRARARSSLQAVSCAPSRRRSRSSSPFTARAHHCRRDALDARQLRYGEAGHLGATAPLPRAARCGTGGGAPAAVLVTLDRERVPRSVVERLLEVRVPGASLVRFACRGDPLDHSVLESIVAGRHALSTRIHSSGPELHSVALLALRGVARVERFEGWRLRSIW